MAVDLKEDDRRKPGEALVAIDKRIARGSSYSAA
jgi:hypothetical protein